MCYAVEAKACSICTSFALTNFHNYSKKSNGPQSPAALEWAKGAKNAWAFFFFFFLFFWKVFFLLVVVILDH